MRPSGDAKTDAAENTSVARLVAIGAAGAIVLAVGMAVGIDQRFVRSEKVAPGVRIAGIGVSGMSAEQASKAVTSSLVAPQYVTLLERNSGARMNIPARDVGLAFDSKAAVRDALAVGREGWFGSRVSARRKAAAGQVNVPLHAAYNTGAFKWVLAKSATRRFARDPKDATISIAGGSFIKRPGADGVAIDIPATLSAVKAFDISKPEPSVTVPVVVKVAHPRVTLADLEPIDTVLATYTTSYKVYERARTNNLTIAANQVDGALIKPGEVFSYNNTVGPRLKSTGFKEAMIFVSGRVEPGLGGGICQVSSTLYNAALLSGMKIRQRSHHSMAVVYVPPGLDATVAYGALDLKFENPLKNAIYIRTSVGGGRLSTMVYGASEDKKSIKIVRTVGSSRGFGVKTVTNSALAPGKRRVVEKGVRGYTVTVKRVIDDGGKQVVEHVSSDRYSPHATLVHVGPSKPKPAPAPASGGAPGGTTVDVSM